MKKKIHLIEEPLLDFGMGQQAPDTHNGLSIFGPASLIDNSHPSKINYSIIGTREGIKTAIDFINRIKMPIMNNDEKQKLWPIFPGYEVVFQAKLSDSPLGQFGIKLSDIKQVLKEKDLHQRTGKMVEIYLNKIKRIKAEDAEPNVILCIVPEEVFKNCRPKSSDIGHTKKAVKRIQLDFFNNYDCELYDYSVDFRRQLKAKSMHIGIPIQIILEPTLNISNGYNQFKDGVTPLSDRAWNLGTTLYYKAGGKPWKLSSVREGVCYIGISYKRTDTTTAKNKDSKSACCAAQMFLKDGDGIVFKGEEGKWYSPKDKTFHLTEQAAESLLKGTIQSYKSLGGKPLTEIFLHCQSPINEEEYKGFKKACPKGVKLVIIKVKINSKVKLFRKGTRPILRGSFLSINEKMGFLWGAGYKPIIETYDGWEVPKPLKIEILFGEADLLQVAKDIFALTKLNYNACKTGESSPVTIKFSQMVGEILVSNPKSKPQPQFKFYI